MVRDDISEIKIGLQEYQVMPNIETKCFSIYRDRTYDLRKDDMKSSKERRLEEFVGQAEIKELHLNPQQKTVGVGSAK